MDLEIKQKLTSNWFKSLQEMFCKTISDFEKNKISFKSTTWKRNLKKDEGGGEYRILKNGKIAQKSHPPQPRPASQLNSTPVVH